MKKINYILEGMTEDNFKKRTKLTFGKELLKNLSLLNILGYPRTKGIEFLRKTSRQNGNVLVDSDGLVNFINKKTLVSIYRNGVNFSTHIPKIAVLRLEEMGWTKTTGEKVGVDFFRVDKNGARIDSIN